MDCLFYFEWLIWGNTKEPLSRGKGLWIRACDELQSNSFTVHLHKNLKSQKNKNKKMLARPPDIPKLISFSTVLSRWLRKSFFFFCFAGEWSRHVCQWQGSLFSLTLITSFTNLQIYYSTVCKGVSAITSSVVSRPVMTTGPMKLLCWN